MSKPIKISCLDIETSPNIVATFQLRNVTIPVQHVIQPSRILGFAAKWVDDKSHAVFYSSNEGNYEHMLSELQGWIEESDAIIHYNGKRFDRKKINWEFAKAGITPPAPAHDIDLWRTVTRNFDPVSSKLQFVGPELVNIEKESSGGMETFLGCMNDDPKAWADMSVYCIRDVDLMPPLYHNLLPWISDHPNMSLYSGDWNCPYCQSKRIQKRGTLKTATRIYTRYWCRDCGGWSKAAKSEGGTDIRAISA